MAKIAMITNSLAINGISTVINNYCININHEKYDISVLAGLPIDRLYINNFNAVGIEVVKLPPKKKNPFHYFLALTQILKQKNFDIVHIHGNSSAMVIELIAAKIAGVKYRIVHSHNTQCTFKAHDLLFPIFNKLYTDAFACGKKAGEWLFRGDPFYIVKNGFDVEKFIFSYKTRECLRRKHGLSQKFVIGHIGRINDQKNQSFLVDIFEYIADKREDAFLIIVGTGPNEEKIKKRIEESRHKEKILLYGETNKPEDLYMLMDVLVFPSLHEGLPVTLIEAQISGLSCLVSDVVTPEAFITNKIQKESLDASAEVWADEVLKMEISNDRTAVYYDFLDSFNEYRIDNCSKKLEEKYQQILKK